MEYDVKTTLTLGTGQVFKQSYKSTKTYGHDLGLSCAFRQWRATHSHCSKLHGYALSFKFVFGCLTRDDRNWVVDFGSLQGLKTKLVEYFDHTTVIAQDDPEIETFHGLDDKGIIDLVVMQVVGCEAFAYKGWQLANMTISTAGMSDRVWVESCEVAEHGANSAIFTSERVR